MLKRLRKFFEPTPSKTPQMLVIEQDHHISKFDVSRSARKVIEQLKHAGYCAYLVGGGVRDLLLDGHPKDFDVATDATPEQVKRVCRGSLIIGKRFRIVHVRFGREIIEVTTFRGSHTQAQKKEEASQSARGMLLRDNVYGDIRSDALRRDFTINALYYDPEDGTILDFAGGLKDLKNRQLRIIGDPNARYKEDPVRMLRAVRFASRLGFSVEPETEAPIRAHADYIADIPPARLFEEVLKLFMSGYATAMLTKLREYGLFAHLFPGTDACLERGNPYDSNLVFAAISNTDKRIRKEQRVTPAFIYAALLWPQLRVRTKELTDEHKLGEHEALQQAADGVISQQLSYTTIPKRFLIPMREIWTMQSRLGRRDGNKAYKLMENPRFRAAYDFLLLREQAGERLDGLGLWWTNFQDADEEKRQDLVSVLIPEMSRRPRRRRKSKAPPAQ